MSQHTTLPIEQDNRPPAISEQEAATLHDTIQRCIALITDHIVEMGEALHRMKETGGYKHYFDTWEQYKASLDIKRATVHCYMRIARLHRERILNLKDHNDIRMFLNTPWTKISEITPILLQKDDEGDWQLNDAMVVDWIHKAHTMLRDDLRADVHYASGGQDKVRMKGVGMFSKMVSDTCGRTIQMTQCRNKYDASNQNWWSVFGNRKVSYIIQLCDDNE